MSSYSENFKTYLDKCDKAKAAADRGDLATAVSYYEDALEYSDKLQKSPYVYERDQRELAARDVQIIEFIKSVKYPCFRGSSLKDMLETLKKENETLKKENETLKKENETLKKENNDD